MSEKKAKKDVGAPKKGEAQKKVSVTCSISNATNEAALKLYGNRGRAIEMAVRYGDIIRSHEKLRKGNDTL